MASRFRGGVDECLTFLDGTPRRSDVHRVGGQALLGKLEGDPSPRRGLIEQIDDRLAPERRHFLDGPLRHFLERLGGVEHEVDLLGREVLEPNEIFTEHRGHAVPPARTSST